MSTTTHPDGSYSAVAKIFHWVTVPLLVAALTTGIFIGHVADASKMMFYAIHESLGLTMLFVAIARLAWRRISPPLFESMELLGAQSTLRRIERLAHAL